MKKSDATKTKLYLTALELFTSQGFDETSMREIARTAKVSLGNIYYYFPSKESLVFEYYKDLHKKHLTAIGDFLETEPKFETRLHHFITTQIDAAQPYKGLARALFKVAAAPGHALSPFSKESQELANESIELLRTVVEESSNRFHPEVQSLLPQYLWMYQLGIIFFWVYDSSKNSEKTYQLIDKTIPLISSLNKLLMSPLSKPIRGKVLSLLNDFKFK